MRSQDLAEMGGAFMAHWLDAKRHDPLRYATYHSISASSDASTIEARVMLAMAGVEYLAWVTNVLEGKENGRLYEKVPASTTLTDLLKQAGVPTASPSYMTALGSLAPSDKQTGPDAVAWLRNRLVHPKDAGEPYRVATGLSECWLLAV